MARTHFQSHDHSSCTEVSADSIYRLLFGVHFTLKTKFLSENNLLSERAVTYKLVKELQLHFYCLPHQTSMLRVGIFLSIVIQHHL